GGRAREVINLIDFQQDRLGHVVAQQLEARIVQQVEDVFATAGEKVVEAQHFVVFAEQPLAKMRADKTRAAGDENSHCALRTAKLPRYSASILVFRKQSIACCGVQTTGSFSLNDVFSNTGTPVSSAKSEIN